MSVICHVDNSWSSSKRWWEAHDLHRGSLWMSRHSHSYALQRSLWHNAFPDRDSSLCLQLVGPRCQPLKHHHIDFSAYPRSILIFTPKFWKFSVCENAHVSGIPYQWFFTLWLVLFFVNQLELSTQVRSNRQPMRIQLAMTSLSRPFQNVPHNTRILSHISFKN